MEAKTYIIRLGTAVLLFAGSVIAINFLVDPYGIHGTPRVSGVNEFKVDINPRVRLLKKYQPNREEYDTLIVGKSRVEMGLNPRHSCFIDQGMQVYNLGIPGAELTTQFSYALNVIYEQPIKRVYLSVDFTDYISTQLDRVTSRPVYMSTGNGSLKYLPDGSLNPDFWLVRLQDNLRSLFSLDAFFSSLKTVSTQGSGASDRDESGFNPGQDFTEMVRVEGPRALFDQKQQEIEKKYGRTWYIRDEKGRPSVAFGDLAEFLQVVTGRGIAVTLFSNPVHENYWDVMSRNGHIALYEDWLEIMTALVREQNSAELVFWNFSGDSAYIHEAVPDHNAMSGPLQWFWEPSHYRSTLGDIMIETMLGESCGSSPGLGMKVH
jgi:hypothetical protein